MMLKPKTSYPFGYFFFHPKLLYNLSEKMSYFLKQEFF